METYAINGVKYTKDEVKQLFYESFGYNTSANQKGEDISTWTNKYQFEGMLKAVRWSVKTNNKDFYKMIEELDMKL